MYRYVAIIWDPGDTAARIEARRSCETLGRGTDLLHRVNAEGLAVFELAPARGGMGAYVLPSARGIILGNLFATRERDAALAHSPAIPDRQARSFVESGGQVLRDEYWGHYVAFLRDAGSRTHYVLRDCSGRIPCYRARLGAIHVVFSDLDDVLTLKAANVLAQIDWQYAAAFIAFSHLQVRDTGLRHVTEVLAGDRITYSQRGVECEAHWNPVDVCRGGGISDYAAARGRMHEVVRDCIHGWASVHQRVLHLLSGGFDSAVVLSLLADVPRRPMVTCLNRFNDAPGEDERAYARAAATRAHVPLIESPLSAGVSIYDEKLLGVPAAPKPDVPTAFALPELQLRNSLAREMGADAVWTGQGGDHIFMVADGTFGASDFLRDHWLGSGLISNIMDAARLSRKSFWSTARATLTSPGKWAPDVLSRLKPVLVSREALPHDLVDYVLHPWSKAATHLPQGRQHQVFLLGELLNRHRPIGNLEYADEHHPLISQPLIELCLRIPTYHLLRGGRSRAMARDAFSPGLPSQIAQREDKGGVTLWQVDLVRRSAKYLRDLLLEGVLASERVLDVQSIETFFNPARPMRQDHYFPILACIAAEAWARSMIDAVQRRERIPPRQHAADFAYEISSADR
jgi:asparagine synthase (glutamine-hydrolysing)